MLFESFYLNLFFEVLLPPLIIACVLLWFILTMHKRTFAAAMSFKEMAIKKHDSLSQRTVFADLSAAVVVCGDIARSPRMQYHAVSLSESAGFKKVHIVGADMGNRCCEKLEKFRASGQASFCLVKEDEKTKASATSQRESWVARVVKRVLGLFGTYFFALRQVCQDQDLSVVLVQTPPVIPTLPIVFLVVTWENIRRAWKANFFSTSSETPEKNNFNEDGSRKLAPPIRIIFDVHNLGYTILQAEKRPKLFVFIYALIENLFCRTGWFSDARITVARALGDHLLKKKTNDYKASTSNSSKNSNNNNNNTVVVMPDAAPDFFRPSSREEIWSQVFENSDAKVQFGHFGNNIPSWFLDEKQRRNRKDNILIAGSTSWTADDDYTVVVDAIKNVVEQLKTQNNNQNKHIWIFISGKGPSRIIFEQAIEKILPNNKTNKSSVVVSTGYFQSFSDYALFLGAADLGLCLHHSSSKLDLPMKGVDMLGAGLPVCALRYLPALPELVTEETGWLFDNSDELSKIWMNLIVDGSDEGVAARKKLEVARKRIQKDRKYWISSWEENVVPLLNHLRS